MSNEFQDMQAKGLEEATALVGDSITYKGIVYPAIVSAIELSNELEDGGLVESLASQLIIAKAKLATEPVAGETLYIGTKKARIHKVSSDSTSWELTVSTATK